MLMDGAKAADFGAGPYAVELDGEDGFYYLTKGALRAVDQGGPYPLLKTAAKRARQLNAEPQTPGIVAGLDLRGTPEEVLARYPDPAPADPGGAAKPPLKEAHVWEAENPAEPDRRRPRKPSTRERIKAGRAPRKVKHGAAATPSVTSSFQGTREEWLRAFCDRARPVFAERGHPLPEKVRVSIGFTGARGGGKVVGACWHEAASTDGTREIFIVPTIDDSSRIADVLTHELCHTLFGPDEKHGRNFGKAARAMGLEGKLTATTAGPGWHEWADPVLADLGAIPHAKLDPLLSGAKKQTTRLLKAECPTCGFTVRVTGKWINVLSERGVDMECPDPDCEDSDGLRSAMCVAVPGEE